MRTERTSKLPHFYTHVIGSLPRPQAVRDLLARRAQMPPERFTAALDDMVRFAIRLQEQAGIDVVSDGEWRRVQYVDEFLDRIGGFEPIDRYEHQGEVKYRRVIVRRLELREAVFARDAEFLRANTDRCTKFALPSPFLIAIRYWKPNTAQPPTQLTSISWSTWRMPLRARRRRSPRRALTSCSLTTRR